MSQRYENTEKSVDAAPPRAGATVGSRQAATLRREAEGVGYEPGVQQLSPRGRGAGSGGQAQTERPEGTLCAKDEQGRDLPPSPQDVSQG